MKSSTVKDFQLRFRISKWWQTGVSNPSPWNRTLQTPKTLTVSVSSSTILASWAWQGCVAGWLSPSCYLYLRLSTHTRRNRHAKSMSWFVLAWNPSCTKLFDFALWPDTFWNTKFGRPSWEQTLILMTPIQHAYNSIYLWSPLGKPSIQCSNCFCGHRKPLSQRQAVDRGALTISTGGFGVDYSIIMISGTTTIVLIIN